VFKVRRFADDTVYALKRIQLDSMARKDQESSLNEVRILASLAHDHIIAYRDDFYEKGCLFLVL
jgi:serine/threonine protein kinase